MHSWWYLFNIFNIIIILDSFIFDYQYKEIVQIFLLIINFLASVTYVLYIVGTILCLKLYKNVGFKKEKNQFEITEVIKPNEFIKAEEYNYYFLKELDRISGQLIIPLIILLGAEKHTDIKWLSIGLCVTMCINKLVLLSNSKTISFLSRDTITPLKESKNPQINCFLYRGFTILIKYIESCIEWIAKPKHLWILIWPEILLIFWLSIGFIIRIFSSQGMIIILIIFILIFVGLFISHNKYVEVSLQAELVDILTNSIDLPENKTTD